MREKWKLIPLIVPLIIASILMQRAIHHQNFFIGFMALIFAWQSGWGIKIELEIKLLEEHNEKTNL